MKYTLFALAGLSLLLSCNKNFEAEVEQTQPQESIEYRSEASICYAAIFSVEKLNLILEDESLNYLRIKPIVDADPEGAANPITHLEWAGVKVDGREFGNFTENVVENLFDTGELSRLPDLSSAEIEAQGPILAEHIIQYAKADTFISGWNDLVHSGKSVTENISYDGETIRYFRIEKDVLSQLVNATHVAKIICFLGLNDEDKLTPVLLGVDAENALLISSGHYAYDFAQPCPEICD